MGGSFDSGEVLTRGRKYTIPPVCRERFTRISRRARSLAFYGEPTRACIGLR